QIKAPHILLAPNPAERRRIDQRIGGIGTSRRLSAPRAMAIDKVLEGQPHLISNATAEAASMHDHATSPLHREGVHASNDSMLPTRTSASTREPRWWTLMSGLDH